MTPEERAKYNKLYKGYFKNRMRTTEIYGMFNSDCLVVKPAHYNFDGSDEKCCSVFGCGKKLSMSEKLFGDKCINHSK